MRIPREKFDKDRQTYWDIADQDGTPESKYQKTMMALVADIHTMLDHLTVEPYEDDTDG